MEHPEQFLQHIKQCLSSKEGIPVKQQRLVFSGPGAQALRDIQESSKQQPAVEEILSSLNQWQVGPGHSAFSATLKAACWPGAGLTPITAQCKHCWHTPPHALAFA